MTPLDDGEYTATENPTFVLRFAGKINQKMEKFVETVNKDDWQDVLSLYSKALHAKAAKMKPDKKKDLIKLDNW